MTSVKEYAQIFKEAFELTYSYDAAIAIMEQIGLDNRTQFISNDRKEKKEFKAEDNRPSIKQINFLKRHNKYRENISRQEANQIISEIVDKLREKAKQEESYY